MGKRTVPGRAPKNLFAAIGHLGQYVIVSPDQQLTMVRLGKTSARSARRWWRGWGYCGAFVGSEE
jgi:hypothetical protein